MRLRILCLILLLTGCMQSAPTDTDASPVSTTDKLVPSPIATDAEPTMIPFEQTATKLVRQATQDKLNADATETAIAAAYTATPRPQDLLFVPTANGLELTITSIAITDIARETDIARWTATRTPLPSDCAQVTDTYHELRLEVFIRASDVGAPDYSLKEISTTRCPADDWQYPYEYQILILPQQHSEDAVIVTALDDIIRRLPNYPPSDPNAENLVAVQIQFFDGSTLFVGSFPYSLGTLAYQAGLRREQLLRTLDIPTEYGRS